MTDLQECIGGMEMEKFYLGFDAGTQSVKVTVYNEKMECVASTSAPTTLTYPHPGWVDMDVDEYLALTINGIAVLVAADTKIRDLHDEQMPLKAVLQQMSDLSVNLIHDKIDKILIYLN